MIAIVEMLLRAPPKRPFTFAVTVASVVLPGLLVLYLVLPSLFMELEIPRLLLLSAAMSLPLIIAWAVPSFIWWTWLVRFDARNSGESPPDSIVEASLRESEKVEMLALNGAAWGAFHNLTIIAVWAYYRPIRLGATLILSGVIPLALALVSLLLWPMLDHLLQSADVDHS